MKVLFIVVSNIRMVDTSLDFASTFFVETICHILSILADDGEDKSQESMASEDLFTQTVNNACIQWVMGNNVLDHHLVGFGGC
jgi:hypothetical protein